MRQKNLLLLIIYQKVLHSAEIEYMADDNSVWCFTNAKKPNLSIDVMGLKSARDFVALLRKEEYSLWMVRRKDLVAAAEHSFPCSDSFSKRK